MEGNKISIITINLNNKEGLERTILSVIQQSYSDFEYIIIDGGSSDGSKDVINKYSDKISFWVSEPDAGIYNAMNKGIKHSNGEYLLILNSGDVLYDNTTLNKVIDFGLDKDIVYGDVYEIVNEQNSYFKKFPDELLFSFFYKYSLGHQASFVNKKLHEKAGLYLETNQIVSDWCFLTMAIFKYNCSYKHIPLTVATCKRDGISCNPDYWSEILKERNAFLEQTFPLYINDYIEMNFVKDEFEKLKQEFQKEKDKGALKKMVRRVLQFYQRRVQKRHLE